MKQGELIKQFCELIGNIELRIQRESCKLLLKLTNSTEIISEIVKSECVIYIIYSFIHSDSNQIQLLEILMKISKIFNNNLYIQIDEDEEQKWINKLFKNIKNENDMQMKENSMILLVNICKLNSPVANQILQNFSNINFTSEYYFKSKFDGEEIGKRLQEYLSSHENHFFHFIMKLMVDKQIHFTNFPRISVESIEILTNQQINAANTANSMASLGISTNINQNSFTMHDKLLFIQQQLQNHLKLKLKCQIQGKYYFIKLYNDLSSSFQLLEFYRELICLNLLKNKYLLGNFYSSMSKSSSNLFEYYFIITKYYPLGSLFDYLFLSSHSSSSSTSGASLNPSSPSPFTPSRLDTFQPSISSSKILTFHEILKILLQLTSAMKYLHEFNVIHRNLSLKSILLTNKMDIKLTGFSYCSIERNRMTPTVGNVIYMAPDLIESSSYTSKIDVYSFSMIAWQLIERKYSPFSGSNLSPIDILYHIKNGFRPEFASDSPLNPLIHQCWHPDPASRPTFHDIHESLLSIQSSFLQSPPSPNPTSSYPIPPSSSSSSLLHPCNFISDPLPAPALFPPFPSPLPPSSSNQLSPSNILPSSTPIKKFHFNHPSTPIRFDNFAPQSPNRNRKFINIEKSNQLSSLPIPNLINTTPLTQSTHSPKLMKKKNANVGVDIHSIPVLHSTPSPTTAIKRQTTAKKVANSTELVVPLPQNVNQLDAQSPQLTEFFLQKPAKVKVHSKTLSESGEFATKIAEDGLLVASDSLAIKSPKRKRSTSSKRKIAQSAQPPNPSHKSHRKKSDKQNREKVSVEQLSTSDNSS